MIAGPSLADPNFRRTVVLLCDHGDEGSMGLVVNRPINAPLAKVFPNLAKLAATTPGLESGAQLGYIYCGGPVATGQLLALRSGSSAKEDDRLVLAQTYLVADVGAALQDLEDGAVSPQEFRFFLGYAGWGRGQLEQELTEDSWITRGGESQLVFSARSDTVWSEALRELGGIYRFYAELPHDPSMN